MVQSYLGDHRRRHAIVVASGCLTSMAIQMAADLEWESLCIAELEVADHEFDENVSGVKRHRASTPLEEVPLRPQAVGLLALRWHHGHLSIVSLEMFGDLEQKIDAAADVEQLAFTFLSGPLRQQSLQVNQV